MRHFIHRHEPPVLDLPIEVSYIAHMQKAVCLHAQRDDAANRSLAWLQVVGETTDLIAVHKPASVPVHVSGQYRKNTVMALLQVERPDLGSLYPVHRLDKPVSGLLLVAKSSAAANRTRALITVSTRLQSVLQPMSAG